MMDDMLDTEMIRIIENNTAGMVATVNRDGSPSVSPKGTFVVVAPDTIAFGNIRSPGTVANLRRSPRLEVCFLDVLARKAVRVTGLAEILARDATPQEVTDRFDETWSEYLPRMKQIVVVKVQYAELIQSPAYDLGYTEVQLRSMYLERLDGT